MATKLTSEGRMCTMCGQQSNARGFRYFVNGLARCDGCKDAQSYRDAGDKRWDAKQAPLTTRHV